MSHNDNRSQRLTEILDLHLHQLPLGQPAFIDHVDWDRLSPGEAQRLREFGIDEGATVEALHRGGLLGGGALACRVGRMTVAMRHDHADAIHVRTGPDSSHDRGHHQGIATAS